MKKCITIVTGIMLAAGSSFADLDDFDGYSVGDELTAPLSGGTGWDGEWVSANATAVTGVVQNADSLNAGGQYLDVDLANASGGQAMGIGRQLADGAPQGDYTVSFLWRADTLGAFNSSNDRFEFYSSSSAGSVNGAGSGGNAETSPYLMGVFGASRGANYPAGGIFGVYNPVNTGDGFSGDRYFFLGDETIGGDGTIIDLVEDTTYSVTIDVHVDSKTWDVSVSDGSSTASASGLKWWGSDTQPFIGFGARGDTENEVRSFSVDDVQVLTSQIPFEIAVSPTGSTSENPTLSAVIVDSGSEFSSAVLSLDGAPVATSSTSAGTTNTISYTASGLNMGMHTGMVVVAGTSPTVSMTNSWTFVVLASGEYMPSGYALIDDFESYPTVARFTNDVTTAGLWHYTDDAGIPTNGTSTGFVGIDDFNGDKIAQFGYAGFTRGFNREIPAVADGENGKYFFRMKSSDQTPDVWFGLSDVAATNAFDWSDFEVQVGLINDDGNSADNLFSLSARNGSVQTNGILSGIPIDTWLNVVIEVDNSADTYNLYASFGADEPVLVASSLAFRNGTGESLSTFLTKSSVGQSDRSAAFDDLYVYDGSSNAGATVNPDIQSFVISGDQVTLTWTSESVGTYRVLRKTELSGGSWTPVATGIAGGESSTTTNVTVSGAAAEFYMIDGE